MGTPGTGPLPHHPRHRLTEARMQRGWSQQEVAERIGSTYVNVSRWERGITKPTPYFRRKLCQLFGKSEQELDLEPPIERESVDGPTTQKTAVDDVKDVVSFASSNNAVYDPSIPLPPATPLVGRDEELARLRQRLRAGGSVALTALNGLPGVGKTALSIALAHDAGIRAHFRDGVLWAGLGPHPNIAGLLSHWGTQLGVSPPEIAAMTAENSTTAWAKTLHTAIGSRSLLLVIDDAWTLEHALAFKVGGPHCAHLVTTRFPTIARAISVDGSIVLQELNDDESMTLLRMLAPGVVERDEPRATALVHAVGGLPLALTLMGNYLRTQTHTGQSRRLQSALQRLSHAEERLHISQPQELVDSHSSLTSETPVSLQSVFAVSEQQLDLQARAALYALSLFPPKPHTFSEEAALAVADCSLETLDTLTDAGLLESTSSERYTLHQTIADYARLHLREEAASDRLIAYAITFVEAHKKAYEQLELESDMILAALDTALRLERRAQLVRGVTAFAPFLLLRGQYALAQHYLEQALQAAEAAADRYGITSTLLYLGEIAQKQGNYAQAESCYQQGLTLARQLADPERISALLTNLAWVTLKRGEYSRAEGYLQEGLKLAKHIEHLERLSALLEMLGSVAGSRGDYAQSEAYIKEGLILARQIGDRERICTMLINLGVTAGEQGNYTQAEEHFQEGLVLARQMGHREWVCALLSNLGEIAEVQGNHIRAEEYFQEGLVLAQQIGHREWVCALLNNLGVVSGKQRNYTQARSYFQQGLALAEQIGIPQMTANALYELGNLYLDQQHIEDAEATFNEMLTTIPAGGRDLVALAQYGLARVAAAQGNMQEAQMMGKLSVSALELMGHRNAKDVKDWLDIIIC